MAMDNQWANAVLIGVVVIALSLIVIHLQNVRYQIDESKFTSSNRSAVSIALTQSLPDSVFFGPHPVFVESVLSYWALQERDIVPQCVVRPRNAEDLAVTVGILKRDFDERVRLGSKLQTFAVRSGGHSPIPGAANINGGVVIDLRLLNKVSPSEDGASVIIGTGATWRDVSKTLDKRGLAVAGSRSSAVGVGGLTLGGGLSIFSPRIGFVCNNILSYEIILANGTRATASESVNPRLWRALKGGSNNFGIVTSFVTRSFPSANIWSGFQYLTASKANQLILALHDFTKAEPGKYDENAAGPLVCFTYLQKLGIQVLATNLVYTKPKAWPVCFNNFKSIGRLWSTAKIQSLTSATHELESTNPPGYRQLFATTTVKNDYDTLIFAHTTFKNCSSSFRHVKGMMFTLVLSPLLPTWAKKGQRDCQGLETRTESLIIVQFNLVWQNSKDDELVNQTTRDAINRIDEYADSHGTADRYRYLNYCASWQKPFDGYGEENKLFLQEMSRAYDPNGLFQRGCVGGFKLDMIYSDS